MFFFYVDESGNTGSNLDSVEQPIHWVVALCVSPSSLRQIENRMSAIAQRYFRARARDAEFEVHGSDIFSGRGECRSLSPAQRVQLYDDLMRLVGEHGCRIFVRGIDKAGHKARAERHGYAPEHPRKLAFMYLVERVDEWLEDHQPTNDLFGEGSPVYGLLVADEQREVNRDIIESFAFWRERGTDHGYRAREIFYLLDTVHYVRSHDSWLIQLTDCLAYLRGRFARTLRESGFDEGGYSQSERAVVRLWREHCRPHVEVDLVWP